MISDDKRFETLYDHYKDSFAQIRSCTNQRTRGFLYLVGLLVVFQISSPADSPTVLAGLLQKTLGVELILAPPVIDSVVWLLMLVVSVRYFRVALTVNLQYEILHQQEQRLCELGGEGSFVRERTGYLSGTGRFGFRELTYWLYTAVFPLMLIVLSAAEYVEQLSELETWAWSIAMNGVLATAVVISTLVYLREVHLPPKNKAADGIDATDSAEPGRLVRAPIAASSNS